MQLFLVNGHLHKFSISSLNLFVIVEPEDQYNEDASLTAAVTRSLSLTQALGEKCLHIDASTASSDDEDNSRHSHSHHVSYCPKNYRMNKEFELV